jgi:hypothetical protein
MVSQTLSLLKHVNNGLIDIFHGRSIVESKELLHLSYTIHATTNTGTAVGVISLTPAIHLRIKRNPSQKIIRITLVAIFYSKIPKIIITYQETRSRHEAHPRHTPVLQNTGYKPVGLTG